jgi:hypothetical protein
MKTSSSLFPNPPVQHHSTTPNPNLQKSTDSLILPTSRHLQNFHSFMGEIHGH